MLNEEARYELRGRILSCVANAPKVMDMDDLAKVCGLLMNLRITKVDVTRELQGPLAGTIKVDVDDRVDHA